MAFEPSMDLDSRKKYKELRQKNDGGQTKYEFSISKEVGYLRQRNHGCFNEVWIWIIQRKKIFKAEK